MIINVKYDDSLQKLAELDWNRYSQIDAAVNAAVAYYEHVFANPITFTINIGWGSLSAGQQARNSWTDAGYIDIPYSQVLTSYQNIINKSGDQIAAGLTLPLKDPTVSSTRPGGGTFRLSLPEAQAWGLYSSAGTPDGVYDITLNSNLNWTFDPNNRNVAGAYDAVGVIEHEISEIMGRVGSLGGTTFTKTPNVFTPLDLFRYDSAGHRQLSPGPGWFSIDGGHTLLKQFNDPANGDDAADWLHTWNGGATGDAFGDATTWTPAGGFKAPGVAGQVTSLDLKVMNVIGWNRAWGLAGTTRDDFNGDGVSDIMYHNNTTGDSTFYDVLNGNSHWNRIGTMPTSYALVGSGDFLGGINTNHVADMLFQNSATGDIGYWHLNDDRIHHGWYDLGSKPGYAFAAVGDFTGQGSSEALLRNNTTGDIGFFRTSNGVSAGWTDTGVASTAYKVVGAGDFNGDGKDDILFRNNATGDMAYWELDSNNKPYGHSLGGSPTAYTVAGIGDFNGDGIQDILMSKNANRYLYVGGYDVSSGTARWHDFGILATTMTVAGTGDYLGNGTSDILLWNPPNGDTGYYAVKNFALDVSPFTHSAWHDIGTTPTSYHVVS